MKYTKGPWKSMNTVEDDIMEFTGPYVDIVAGPFNARQPAIAAGHSKEEALANAHLIAAAPYMYEAAKALIACLDMNALSEEELEGITYLDNALAKAEGK